MKKLHYHCTSTYPCPPDNMNIRAIDTLKNAFKLPVGLSDHVIEDTISLAAVAGRQYYWKHFTLDKSLEGPDHIYYLEPHEFKDCFKDQKYRGFTGSGIKSSAWV